jgi:hypothetical protein
MARKKRPGSSDSGEGGDDSSGNEPQAQQERAGFTDRDYRTLCSTSGDQRRGLADYERPKDEEDTSRDDSGGDDSDDDDDDDDKKDKGGGSHFIPPEEEEEAAEGAEGLEGLAEGLAELL